MSKKVSKKRGKKGKRGKSDKDKSVSSSSSSNEQGSPSDESSASESKSDTEEGSKNEPAKKQSAETISALPVATATDTDMPSGVGSLAKVDNAIGLIEQAFLMVFLFSLITVGTYQFVAGYLFNVNSTWPFEALQYLVFAIAMIGAALAAQKNQMMSMDFLSRKLSDKNRTMLRIATNLFVIFACYLLVRGGLKGVVATEGAEYELLPKAKAYLVLPIGAALIAIHYILHTLCDVLYLSAGQIPPEEEGMKAH